MKTNKDCPYNPIAEATISYTASAILLSANMRFTNSENEKEKSGLLLDI